MPASYPIYIQETSEKEKEKEQEETVPKENGEMFCEQIENVRISTGLPEHGGKYHQRAGRLK